MKRFGVIVTLLSMLLPHAALAASSSYGSSGDTTTGFLAIGLLWLITGSVWGAFCAMAAGPRHRDRTNWFFLGLIFGFLALVAILLMGSPQQQDRAA